MLLHLSRILGTTLLAISAISAHQNGSLARLGSAEPEGFTVPKTFGESAESTRTIHPSSKDCNWILPHFGCLPLFNQDIFVSSMLQQHNQYRARHGSPPLIWSESLALLALQNAETNLARNTFLETPDNEYGECMASQEGSNNPLWLAWIWYNETRRYSYRDAQFTEDTGHFAQMVWRDTKALGCAYAKQTNRDAENVNWYQLTCEYDPSGNYRDLFRSNVAKPVPGIPYPIEPDHLIDNIIDHP